jgi:hypothetical protein
MQEKCLPKRAREREREREKECTREKLEKPEERGPKEPRRREEACRQRGPSKMDGRTFLVREARQPAKTEE